MVKTAKQMFKILGYTFSGNYIICNNKKTYTTYHYINEITDKNVVFYLKNKKIIVYRDCNYEAEDFDIYLLKAINKQIEELGWNNETN